MESRAVFFFVAQVDVIAQRAAIGKQIPEVSAALEEIGWVPPERCGWKSQREMVGIPKNHGLGGGFKYFLFSPLLGGMIQFD